MRALLAPLLALPAFALAAPAHAQTQSTQQQYQLRKSGDAPATLTLVDDAPIRQPGDHEVLVRVRAVSLNRRDVYVRLGRYPGPKRENVVPLSDGAGEVAAIGSKVTRFKKGDRVAAIFFQGWLDGRATAASLGTALGGAIDGMLSQYVTLHENGLVTIPAHLSFEQAATLPCAGVTAWNGLVTRGRIESGDHVLLLGTGGVSIFGLQLAKALGARPIITSSSDEKLARAKALGAFATVNYKTTPEWDKAVLAATGGAGVQQALEVGGAGTLPKTLASLGVAGHVALIGGLTEFGGDIPSGALLGRTATASGIYVGSRANFEALNAFIDKHKLELAVDRVFEFKDAAKAYDYLDSPELFGKVVIRL